MKNKKTIVTADLEKMHLPGLSGKKVAITAGASGIGLAIARLLQAQGARIAICDIDANALKRVSSELGVEIAAQADVSNDREVEAFFEKVGAQFGQLDALVNNAGIAGPTGKIEDHLPADWRRCVDICLTGQFLCARQAIPMIKANGGGALVNMASAAAKHGYAYRTP